MCRLWHHVFHPFRALLTRLNSNFFVACTQTKELRWYVFQYFQCSRTNNDQNLRHWNAWSSPGKENQVPKPYSRVLTSCHVTIAFLFYNSEIFTLAILLNESCLKAFILSRIYDLISELIKIQANLNIEKSRVFCMFRDNERSISDRLK
jgi:hypothetical protein